MELSSDLIFQIYQCDTIFSRIDQNGDCQLSMQEFEDYVHSMNKDHAVSKDSIMK